MIDKETDMKSVLFENDYCLLYMFHARELCDCRKYPYPTTGQWKWNGYFLEQLHCFCSITFPNPHVKLNPTQRVLLSSQQRRNTNPTLPLQLMLEVPRLTWSKSRTFHSMTLPP